MADETSNIINQLDNIVMPFETRRGVIAITELLQEHPQALNELEAIIKFVHARENILKAKQQKCA